MQIEKIDHVNLRTNDLPKMVAWYTNILGLHSGDRPTFPFHGAWLYAGKKAIIHLVEVNNNPGFGSESDLKLEHFALSAKGKTEFEAKLLASGEKYQTNEVSDIGVIQYNLWDPDGNHIHIDFQLHELLCAFS